MKCLRWWLLPFVFALPLLAHGAPASVEDVIAKARSYLGKERDLEGIRSIHYRGRIEVRDSAGVLQENGSGTIEMILQKPLQQKVVRVAGPLRHSDGLDDFTGWQRSEPSAEPEKGRTTILALPKLRRLQASAFENLSFFRGLDKRGGRVEWRGEATVDGRPAVNLAFIHPGDVVFLRSFDRETGRLLQTEGDGGEQMREEEEVLVQGIRFPKRLVSSRANAEGQTFTVTLFFDEITLNEAFPPETFAVPMLAPR